MRTLQDAWTDAYTYLDSLPYSRTPVITLAYHKNINGHAPVSDGYCSVQMTPAERKGRDLLFHSVRAYNESDPAVAIDKCIAQIKEFLNQAAAPAVDPFA